MTDCAKNILKDVKELSKLDLRNEIERILDEHSNDYKNVD